MRSKADVWQGTLALMVLKTLERGGSLHGYGIARQIEQTSADLLSVNYGTFVSRFAQARTRGIHHFRMGSFGQQSEGEVLSTCTRAGRETQIENETQEWEQTTAILARFLNSQIA